MKMHIDSDEAYPVYSISPLSAEKWRNYWRIVDVSPELKARYDAAEKEYQAVQDELERLRDTAVTIRSGQGHLHGLPELDA
jgi:hypothetical protein